MDYDQQANGMDFTISSEADKHLKISEENYLSGMAVLKASFNSLKIQRENLEVILQYLRPYSLFQFKKAIVDLCQNCEKIPIGTNLVSLILKAIQKFRNDKKPIGWICQRCHEVVPLTELRCDCEFVGELSKDEKRETIRLMRQFGATSVADSLERMLEEKNEPEDQIPF